MRVAMSSGKWTGSISVDPIEPKLAIPYLASLPIHPLNRTIKKLETLSQLVATQIASQVRLPPNCL